MPPKPPIKAQALFDEKELTLFVQWQYLQSDLPQERYFTLPTAFEYADYIHWRDYERTRYLPRPPGVSTATYAPLRAERSQTENPLFKGYAIAEKCGHPLHPAHPAVRGKEREEESEGPVDLIENVEAGTEKDREEEGKVLRCPNCILFAHLKLLVAVTDNWNNAGGPWRDYNVALSMGSDYMELNRAYHRAKLGLINAVMELEDWAEAEAIWEGLHPDEDVAVVKKYSAAAAIAQYRRGVTFPARLIDEESWHYIQVAKHWAKEQFVPSTPSPAPKKRKSLSWTPETPEDTKHRSNAFWSRNCTAYDFDSPHKCPDEEGWHDTSFLNDETSTPVQIGVTTFTSPAC